MAVLDRPRPPRDYTLTGPGSRRAIELGLADARWYRPPIDPERLQALTMRSNGRAARDVVLWLGLLVGTGVLAWFTVWSWWSIPAFAVYGALYGASSDPRWHECGHGTAFRSRWANDVVYYLASFMLLREPTMWRWSHVRHHSDTIIVGRDPEVLFTRPFRVRNVLPNLLNLVNGPKALWRMARHAAGAIDDDARDFVPARRAAPRGVGGAGVPRRAGRRRRLVDRHRLDRAADVHRPAVVLRRLVAVVLRHRPARRSARGRPRPPAEHAHRLHEPGVPVPVPEHELPPRAPPLPDGAVPRVAGAAPRGRPPPAAPEHVRLRRLPRDRRRPAPPAPGPRLADPGPGRAGRHRPTSRSIRRPPPWPRCAMAAASTSVASTVSLPAS